ncbi:hypothetical protein [Mastigocoleus testarum]|nr:hypothetical protein [Mastigocoleus testarum]
MIANNQKYTEYKQECSAVKAILNLSKLKNKIAREKDWCGRTASSTS